MFLYYLMLVLGALFVVGLLFTFISIYKNRKYTILNLGKSLGIFLLGVLMLAVTLPSLKFIVFKEYDVVSGKCVIDIQSGGRSSVAEIIMRDTGEIFTFTDIPALDVYGSSIPYHCEVTVTKDHMFEIGYKIFDAKTQELIITNQ